MKIEKLEVNQIVYSVLRRKMGNTSMRTTSVFTIRIIEIHLEEGYVIASWNGNPARKFYGRDISKWRKNKPVMVQGVSGRERLATRAEIKAKEIE